MRVVVAEPAKCNMSPDRSFLAATKGTPEDPDIRPSPTPLL